METKSLTTSESNNSSKYIVVLMSIYYNETDIENWIDDTIREFFPNISLSKTTELQDCVHLNNDWHSFSDALESPNKAQDSGNENIDHDCCATYERDSTDQNDTHSQTSLDSAGELQLQKQAKEMQRLHEELQKKTDALQKEMDKLQREIQQLEEQRKIFSLLVIPQPIQTEEAKTITVQSSQLPPKSKPIMKTKYKKGRGTEYYIKFSGIKKKKRTR